MPDPLKRLRRRRHDDQRLRIGQPDVLTGENEHPPQDKTRIFPGVQHFRHPIQRRVGIGAAHALDKRADRVVVLVAALVVAHRALLDALLGHGQIDQDRAVRAGLGGPCGEFERIQGAARIPSGDPRQMGGGVIGQADRQAAQAALLIVERLFENAARPDPR